MNLKTKNKQLTIDHILNDLNSFFTSNDKFKRFFKSDIKWLSNVQDSYKNSKVRVGLIGITSSGKSTLINALIGERLLPQKVKPSSSVLVVCGYSINKKAIVFFEDESNKKPKTITANIAVELEKFGDEQHNPKNKLQVKEIHLYTPKYKLSKNITLVDSPGLDAYEMEAHEKITLQLALPTLDMVLFLTTVKASSDRENLNRIDEITQDDKPLMVVQNMIDSINAKVVRGGIVEKSINEIREEHLNRIKKLLQKAEKSSTKKADIFQVSALDALNGKIEKSNINNIISSLDKNEKKLSEVQQQNRVKQLQRKLESIFHEISNLGDGGDLDNKLDNNQKLFTEFEKINHDVNLDVDSKINQSNFKVNNILNKIENSNETNVSEVRNILKEYKKITNEFEKELSSKIKKSQQVIMSFAGKTNLTNQDLTYAQIKSSGYYAVDVITEQEINETKRKVKVGGFVSGTKRFFGSIFGGSDWGYETVIDRDETTIVNKIKTINEIEQSFNKWVQWYYDTSYLYDDQTQRNLERIKKELNLNKSSIIEKRNSTILDSDKKRISEYLKDIKIEINKIAKIDSTLEKIKQEKYNSNIYNTTIDIPEYILNVLKVAHINSYHSLYAIRNFCIEKMDKKDIVIWGWDSGDVNQFMNLFFQFDKKIDNTSFSSSIATDYGNIIVINENNYLESKHLNETYIMNNQNVGVFINVDLSQSGFFEKKYHESIIKGSTKNKVTWVIQGLDILRKDDRFIEAFVNFENFLIQIKSNNDLIIVSSKDPFYSLLSHELQNISRNKKMLLADERAIIERIGLNRENEVSSYIKNYLSEIQS